MLSRFFRRAGVFPILIAGLLPHLGARAQVIDRGAASSAHLKASGRAELLIRRLDENSVRRQEQADSLRMAQPWTWSGQADGVTFTLFGLLDGHPVFRATHTRHNPRLSGPPNLAAGMAARVGDVRSGGWLGVNLTGSGQTVAVWDAGTALATHVEFGGRVSILGSTLPAATHATHVTGTIAASGIRPDAQGLAPEVRVTARDWQNDEVEMALAGREGLLVSNHSYGTFGGWVKDLRGTGRWSWMGDPSVSESEDFRFGFYGSEAADWDAIAASSPGYVIVKSAGNERADRGPLPGSPHDVFDGGWRTSTLVRPPDGGNSGYDSILDAGTAKNVLTVGAVEDLQGEYTGPESVVMTTFSGWGPTDDGRIKPDLVANGTSVLSSTSAWNESYAYSSGTSMAAPVVTGVVALVQQAFREHLSVTPSSALIRAILIHSADEAGPSEGPDYRFGWGLINAGRAVSLVLDEASGQSRLVSGSLVPGEIRRWTLSVPPGGPLDVTLAWTDPPSPVPASALNRRDPALVNDLDLVVRGPDGAFLPWVLDPEQPGQPARRGINRVDPLERVQAAAVAGGTYEVEVRLSPEAPGLQDFELVLGPARSGPSAVSGLAGLVLLDSAPVAGVQIQVGNAQIASASDGTFVVPTSGASGLITLIPDARYGFLPDTARVDVSTTRFVRFEASSSARIDDIEIFASPQLLRPMESEFRRDVASTASGGVYGMNIILASWPGLDLSGGRVVVDFEADPRTGSYAGARADAFAVTAADWPISPLGDGRFYKRVPLFWQAGSMAPGPVSVPIRVMTWEGREVARDTLNWHMDRADDQGPLILPRIDVAGRGFALPGQELIVRADIVDGSAIANVTGLLFDRDDQSPLGSFTLRDNGDRNRSGDLVEGDRLFGAVYSPRLQADFRLDLEAVDTAGNRSLEPGAWYFSSRPFQRRHPWLLATYSQNQADTDRLRRALHSVGVPTDYWEFDVRGQIPDSLLLSYQGVIWSWEDTAVTRTVDLDQLALLISTDRPLVLLGSAVTGDWLRQTASISPAGEAFGAVAVGQPGDAAWGGRHIGLVAPSRLAGLTAPDAATLLTVESLPVALLKGSLLVSTLRPSQVDELSLGGYLRTLLYSATGDPTLFGEATAQGGKASNPEFGLDPPYPNPAGATTTVRFTISTSEPTLLEAFDLLGRRIAILRAGTFPSGSHEVSWDTSQVSPGLYLIRLRSSGRQAFRQVIVGSGTPRGRD